MNDRFKFRCWDKENKCMHYPTRYSNFNIVNGVIVKIESYLTGNGVYRGKGVAYEFDDAILMQCTGLKDKNGKLIYEGDVVKVDKNTYADSCLLEQFENENAMITYREELGRYNIEFMPKDNSGCNVMDLMADFYYFLKWKPCGKLEYGILEYIEVIGNIYQNPEILEDTECQK